MREKNYKACEIYSSKFSSLARLDLINTFMIKLKLVWCRVVSRLYCHPPKKKKNLYSSHMLLMGIELSSNFLKRNLASCISSLKIFIFFDIVILFLGKHPNRIIRKVSQLFCAKMIIIHHLWIGQNNKNKRSPKIIDWLIESANIFCKASNN